jgi:outer membrane protein
MKRSYAAAVLSVAVVTSAHAQSAGQWVINAGWSHFAPQGSGDPLRVTALGQSAVISGTGASIPSGDTLGLTASYYVTDHISADASMGIPPTWHLNGSGTLAGFGELGTARAWSPAILVNYHFGEPNSRLRPYLGAGITYTWFSNIKLSNAVSAGQLLFSPTVGAALEGPTSVSLSRSFAPVINAGLTYNIDSHWSIGASIAYSWLTTKATLTTQSSFGTVTSTTKLKVNPIVTLLSVGYRF